MFPFLFVFFKAIFFFQEKLVVDINTVCIILHKIPEIFFNAQEKPPIPEPFGIKGSTMEKIHQNHLLHVE